MNENRENTAKARDEQGTPKAPLISFADVLGSFRADADAAHEAKLTGVPRGPITGFNRLDREIGHSLAPGLHGVHGNAGSGKTAFALQLAATCRFPALYVTCEMAPTELLRRHTARITKTYLGRLKSGEMTGEDAERLARQAIESTPLLSLMDGTRGPVLTSRIQEGFEIIKRKYNVKTAFIVIDSLQSWIESAAVALPAGASSNEYELLNFGIKSLRDLSHEISSPILFISERNRDSMKTGGLNAGAGSRKIEYGAETVFDLDRDMKEVANGAGEYEVILRIAKNRHGSVGVEIPLYFNGALQSFREQTTTEAVERAAQSADTRTSTRKPRNLF
jgi:replicative DNA helicase